MAHGQNFDRSLLFEAWRQWTAAPYRDRGGILEQWAQRFGTSASTLRRRLNTLSAGKSVVDASAPRRRGKSRRSATNQAALDRVAQTVAVIQRATANRDDGDTYSVGYDDCLEIAVKQGRLTQEEACHFHRTTVQRRMRELEISTPFFSTKRRRAAVEMVADYPLEITFLDATPMDRYMLFISEETGNLVQLKGYNSKDKHLPDIIEHRRLKKIWCYYYVDLFSRCFLMRAYAPEPRTKGARLGGENSEDYLDFMTFCFLTKEDRRIPVEGLPENMISDLGARIIKGPLGEFLNRLDVSTRAHGTGHSDGKAPVESRIKHFKQKVETRLATLQPGRIKSLEELNGFLMRWCIYVNHKNGYFARFVEGASHNPIRACSKRNIEDALVQEIVRKTDKWGCVKIDNQQLFANQELPRGTELRCYRNFRGQYIGRDPVTGNIYALDPIGNRQSKPIGKRELLNVDDPNWFRETEAQKRRKEIQKEARKVRKSINLKSLEPDLDGVIYFPPLTKSKSTFSFQPPERFETPDDARVWLYEATGLSVDDLAPEDRDFVDQQLEGTFSRIGYISGSGILQIVQLIQKAIEEAKRNADADDA